MSDADHPLQAVRSTLEEIVLAADEPGLRRCLEGKGLPALGGQLHPAEILYRALTLPPCRLELAAKLAALLARLCDRATRSMDETLQVFRKAASEIGKAVTPEWDDFGDGERYVFSLLLLASRLPRDAGLFRALAALDRIAQQAGGMLAGGTRAGRQLRRALACQQIDDSLEERWLGLIERVEKRAAGNRLTAEQKEDLLDAWTGLLWIPPSPSARESASTLPLERAAGGLLAIHRASSGTSDGVAILRWALGRLDGAYPRSPELWRDRLAPHLPGWPETLQAAALEQWPILAAEALHLTKLVPEEAADVWEALTRGERENIGQSAAVGRDTWGELWQGLEAGAPRAGLSPRRWRRGLTQIRQALEDRFPALAPELRGREPQAAAAIPESEDEAAAGRSREVGQAYQISVLSIEVAETEPVAEARKQSPEGLETLFRSFRNLVHGIAATYGGESLSWRQAGGLMTFWSPRSFDHAVMTGLKVLHNLPVFNLDPALNPLSIPIRIRAAAHDAVVIYQRPLSSVRSADIDFAVELQRHYTDPAELAITRPLYERVDPRLKPHFQFKGRFASEPIYICRLPASKKVPEEQSLKEIGHRLKLRAAPLREILGRPPSEVDLSMLESMSTSVDEIYSILNRFCSTFGQENDDWPRELYSELAEAAAELAREEAETWRVLRRSFIGGKLSAGKADKLEAIVRAASRQRSRPVVILERLGQRFRVLAGTEVKAREPATAVEIDDDLVKKLKAFIKADALDSVTLLTELLLNRKSSFLAYLLSRTSESRHRALIEKLWETADLVLLDDLYSIRGHQRSDEEKVIDALIGDQVADHRFRLVRRLLEDGDEPQETSILDALRHNGRPANEQDLQIVWRCLVLGHPSDGLRRSVARKLSRDSMWQAISHPSIPIASIHAIGERVNKVEQEDTKKIFFDCVRARLADAIESCQDDGEISSLTQVILMLLDFSFLAESGYFERFDDLLRKFLERAQAAGLKVEYFDNLRRTLDRAHEETGDRGPSKPPAGLKKLPLAIQRRLAGESVYLYWFVTHPDSRIACETLRHVGLMNVERVLRLREVNKDVLAALLRKPELFTRTQAQLAALHHPKCDQLFAGRYLSALTRSPAGVRELTKIAADPSANPVVRGLAKRAAAARGRSAGSGRI